MFRYLSIFAFGVSFAFGQNGHKTEGSKPSRRQTSSPTARAAAAPAVTIPAGATETSPGVYKHTDASGKNWIYRQTPFGVVKSADGGATAPPPAAAETSASKRVSPFAAGKNSPNPAADTALTKAVEDGDTIRFERSTPFGPTRWTRKRSELNADEAQILEHSRATKSEGAGNK